MQGIVPSTGATAANQSEEISLIETLNSLIETNNYLVQFLTQLTGAMNSGQPALRTIPIASVSTAVTGPITSAQSIAEKAVAGISYTQRVAIENNTAIQSNINNAVAA